MAGNQTDSKNDNIGGISSAFYDPIGKKPNPQIGDEENQKKTEPVSNNANVSCFTIEYISFLYIFVLLKLNLLKVLSAIF